MSRSPLVYPMNRSDAEAGGAADLQTDIMRFMAILALCLVAIFALVQSIPLVPEPVAQAAVVPASAPEPPPTTVEKTPAAVSAAPKVELTRPPPRPIVRKATPPPLTRPAPVEAAPAEAPPLSEPTTAPAMPSPQQEGFTLRFESDIALTRLVASGRVGFYAINQGRAQRMAVSDSRVSFWHASTPASFHEMEHATVPGVVVDALERTGADAGTTSWGVTLPGDMRRDLDSILRERSGGALVIGGDGQLRLEES